MASKSLEYIFKGKDEGVLSQLREQGATADQVKAKYLELEKASTSADKAKKGQSSKPSGEGDDLIKQLKGITGEESKLGGIGKILLGGGAVAGVSAVFRAVGEGADKAKEFKQQFDAGKISALGMAAGFATSLPVIGTMINGFDKVENLLASFPGLADSWIGKLAGLSDRRYAEELRKEEAVRKVILDGQTEALERQQKLVREIATETRAANNRAQVAPLQGQDKALAEQTNAATERTKAIADKRKEAVDEDRKAQVAEGQKIRDNAELSAAQRFDGLQRLSTQHRANVARINQQYDALDKAEAKATYAEENAAAMQNYVESLQVVRDYNKASNDTTEDADNERLKTLNSTLAAEYNSIIKNASDKKDAIDKAAREQAKGANPDNRAMILEAAERNKQAVDRQSQMATENASYKAIKDGQIQALQAQAAAGDGVAAGELKRLQNYRTLTDQAKQLQAVMSNFKTPPDVKAAAKQELEALQDAYAKGTSKTISDSQIQTLKQLESAGDYLAGAEAKRLQLADQLEQRQGELLAIARDQTATVEQRKQAEQGLAALTQARAAEATKGIRDESLSLLQMRAEYGATFNERRDAEKELAQQRLSDEFKQRQAEAQSIIDNEQATAEQKVKARANLKEFAELAGREYDKQVFGKGQALKLTFGLEENLGALTGVLASAQSKRDPTEDLVKVTAEGQAVTKTLIDALNTNTKAQAAKPPAQPQPPTEAKGQPAAPTPQRPAEGAKGQPDGSTPQRGPQGPAAAPTVNVQVNERQPQRGPTAAPVALVATPAAKPQPPAEIRPQVTAVVQTPARPTAPTPQARPLEAPQRALPGRPTANGGADVGRAFATALAPIATALARIVEKLPKGGASNEQYIWGK